MYQLILPKPEFEDSYKRALSLYKKDQESAGYLHHNPENEFSWREFFNASMQLRYRKNGISATMYWLIYKNEYIGTGIVYNGLTKFTEKCGGHMGYIISPQFRHKGHGKAMASALLNQCRMLGIKTALITCSDTNIASRKIVEYNGGILIDRITQNDGRNYISIRRYLVDTGYKINTILPGSFRPDLRRLQMIHGSKLTLDLQELYGKSLNSVETFVYHMKDNMNHTVGRITFTVGLTEAIYYCGNIGYRVDKEYRGQHYAAIATKMLYDQMIDSGYKYDVIITTNPDNTASRKTCEFLGCRLLEIVEIPPHDSLYKIGDRYKCRYILE